MTLDLTNADYNTIGEFESMREPVFNLIIKHCNDGAMEAIRLTRVTLKSHSREMHQFFGRLKKIRLDFCLEIGNALASSKACTDLQINGSKRMCDFNFDVNFPKLETFVLRYTDSIAVLKYNDDCADFLCCHHKLKILKLTVSTRGHFDLNAIAELKEL